MWSLKLLRRYYGHEDADAASSGEHDEATEGSGTPRTPRRWSRRPVSNGQPKSQPDRRAWKQFRLPNQSPLPSAKSHRRRQPKNRQLLPCPSGLPWPPQDAPHSPTYRRPYTAPRPPMPRAVGETSAALRLRPMQFSMRPLPPRRLPAADDWRPAARSPTPPRPIPAAPLPIGASSRPGSFGAASANASHGNRTRRRAREFRARLRPDSPWLVRRLALCHPADSALLAGQLHRPAGGAAPGPILQQGAKRSPAFHAGRAKRASPGRSQGCQFARTRSTDLSRSNPPQPAGSRAPGSGRPRHPRARSPRHSARRSASAASYIPWPHGTRTCAAAGRTGAWPPRRQAPRPPAA